jgi:hypothetical protein
VADTLAAAIAAALNTHQWFTNPDYPRLQELSAHSRHTYDHCCAICTADLDRIAAVTAQVAQRHTGPLDASARAVHTMRRTVDLDARYAEISAQAPGQPPDQP